MDGQCQPDLDRQLAGGSLRITPMVSYRDSYQQFDAPAACSTRRPSPWWT
jgi:hypothetical protein